MWGDIYDLNEKRLLLESPVNLGKSVYFDYQSNMPTYPKKLFINGTYIKLHEVSQYIDIQDIRIQHSILHACDVSSSHNNGSLVWYQKGEIKPDYSYKPAKFFPVTPDMIAMQDLIESKCTLPQNLEVVTDSLLLDTTGFSNAQNYVIDLKKKQIFFTYQDSLVAYSLEDSQITSITTPQNYAKPFMQVKFFGNTFQVKNLKTTNNTSLEIYNLRGVLLGKHSIPQNGIVKLDRYTAGQFIWRIITNSNVISKGKCVIH